MSLVELSGAPEPGDELCRLDELDPDLGTRRYMWFDWDGPRRFFLVRQGDMVRAFVNECPHAGVNLDHPAGQLFNAERTLFECSFHGAQFRIDDGHCVAGPCVGRALRPFAITITDGIVRAAG